MKRLILTLVKKVDDGRLQDERHKREIQQTEWRRKVDVMALKSELDREKDRIERQTSTIIKEAGQAIAEEKEIVTSNGYWRHFILDKEGMHEHGH